MAFKNLESISIENTQTARNISVKGFWPFSLVSLLSILESTKIKRMDISGSTPDGKSDGKSWLSELWEKDGSLLKESYANKEFRISFAKNLNEHCISICKI